MELGSQLHETFQSMLSSVIPVLLNEANAAASFFLLWKGTHAFRLELPASSVMSDPINADVPQIRHLSEEGAALIETLLSVSLGAPCRTKDVI